MFILLETIENYLISLSMEDCNSAIFEKVCSFVIAILKVRQTYEFLDSIFAFLRFFYSFFLFLFLYLLLFFRFFVEKFGSLFSNDSAFLVELSYYIMKYCNCSKDTTRYQASALLFLVMRKQYECNTTQFHRISVQLTIAVSKLVGLTDGLRVSKFSHGLNFQFLKSKSIYIVRYLH